MEVQNQTPMQTLTTPIKSICKECKFATLDSYYFCPNCGKKLKEPPFKFSWGKTITIIFGAVLFPPFGLIPGIKYLLKDDTKAQIIGVVTIALTFIITGVLIIYSMNLLKQLTSSFQQINQAQGLINNMQTQP